MRKKKELSLQKFYFFFKCIGLIIMVGGHYQTRGKFRKLDIMLVIAISHKKFARLMTYLQIEQGCTQQPGQQT